MPQVEHPQHWFKTHPFAVWGGFGLVLLVGGAAVAAMSLGMFDPKEVSPAPSTQLQAQKFLGKVADPTAEEIQAAKNAVRSEGIISSITATVITLTPTGQTKSVTVKLSDATKYSIGPKSKVADKASLRVGQMAIVGYDASTGGAISIWGGYNE